MEKKDVEQGEEDEVEYVAHVSSAGGWQKLHGGATSMTSAGTWR